MEPINDCAIDQGRELPCSVTEGISDWGEAQRHVKVSAHPINEELPAVCWGDHDFSRLYGGRDVCDNSVNSLLVEEIVNFTRRQQIVDVDEEMLLGDLTFGEQEAQTLILATSFFEVLSQVFLQFINSVRR